MTKAPFAIPLRPDYCSRDRLFAAPGQKSRPCDFLFQALAVEIKHLAEERKRGILDVLKQEYGDGLQGEKIRTVMARMVTKAATIPADTTTSGWADTFVWRQ